MWNWIVALIGSLLALFFGIGMALTGYSVNVGLITFGVGLLIVTAWLFVRWNRWRGDVRRAAAEDVARERTND